MTDTERFQKLEEMVQEQHDFWNAPTIGGLTRADRLDRLLSVAEHSKFTIRALVWLFGVVMTGLGAWTVIQKFMGGGT